MKTTTAKNRRMTKAQMRVRIARDVIAQVKSKLLYPTGCYVDIPGSPKPGSDLKAYVAKRKCGVCAKGAIFIAHVRRHDKVVVPDRDEDCDGFSGEEICRPLLAYFSRSQLSLIEAAYEGWTTRHPRVFEFFGANYARDTSRNPHRNLLLAIMKNIIANGGTFRPEKA